MKKRWLFVPLLAGTLALSIAGSAVLANGDGTSGSSPFTSFAARVAAILGLDEAKVQDAMKQATKQIQDEALKQKLDRMVENGRLTREQADQYYQWYQSRPDALSPGMPFGMPFRGPRHGFHGGRMWGDPFQGPAPTPTPKSSGTTSF